MAAFTEFYSKNYEKYKQIFPFIKKAQLKSKMKQIWEREKEQKGGQPRENVLDLEASKEDKEKCHRGNVLCVS